MGLFKFDDVGIDLGTSNVRVFVKSKGIVLNEPSVVAVNRNTGELMAIGEEAHLMVGRTPDNIVTIRPLRNGVISNFHDTERMLRYFLQKVIGKRLFFRPRVVVCFPSGVTDVEKRALIEVTEEAGARHAGLIEEPVAAAIGAGIDIGTPDGNLVIDIGGGTTDIAVISLGGIVVGETLRTAGDKFNEAIVKYMRRKHRVLIGERTAEDIKINIGSVFPRTDDVSLKASGRNLNYGLPKSVDLSPNDTIEALEEPVNSILEALHRVLEKTPPQIAADIAHNGICLTGGGALLYGLDRLISEKTGLPCYVAEDAISCVITGTGKSLDNLSYYSGNIVQDYRNGDYYSN
jgi:rod shape-determining protein MreB and related proteins